MTHKPDPWTLTAKAGPPGSRFRVLPFVPGWRGVTVSGQADGPSVEVTLEPVAAFEEGWEAERVEIRRRDVQG